MHRTIVGHRSEDDNGRLYKLQVTPHNKNQMAGDSHPISAEDYLRNEMMKSYKEQMCYISNYVDGDYKYN